MHIHEYASLPNFFFSRLDTFLNEKNAKNLWKSPSNHKYATLASLVPVLIISALIYCVLFHVIFDSCRSRRVRSPSDDPGIFLVRPCTRLPLNPVVVSTVKLEEAKRLSRFFLSFRGRNHSVESSKGEWVTNWPFNSFLTLFIPSSHFRLFKESYMPSIRRSFPLTYLHHSSITFVLSHSRTLYVSMFSEAHYSSHGRCEYWTLIHWRLEAFEFMYNRLLITGDGHGVPHIPIQLICIVTVIIAGPDNGICFPLSLVSVLWSPVWWV